MVESDSLITSRGGDEVKLWELHVTGNVDTPACSPLVLHLRDVVAVCTGHRGLHYWSRVRKYSQEPITRGQCWSSIGYFLRSIRHPAFRVILWENRTRPSGNSLRASENILNYFCKIFCNISGLAGGLSMLFYRNSNVSLYLFWKSIEVTFTGYF